MGRDKTYVMDARRYAQRVGRFRTYQTDRTRLTTKGTRHEPPELADFDTYMACRTCGKPIKVGDMVHSKSAGPRLHRMRHIECARRVGIIS